MIFGLNISAQNLIINADIKFDSTEIKITRPNFTQFAYSSLDRNKKDSLIVSFGTIGTSLTSININLKNKPKAHIILWSDYPEYNGKNYLRVEFEIFNLEINNLNLKKGDRFMGKIKGKSKMITNNNKRYQIEIDGFFNHIIGKQMIKKNQGDKYEIIDKN